MRAQQAENAIDEIWSKALDKIMKADAPSQDRPELGSEIDLAVAQAGSSTLLSSVPTFTKMLYSGGYNAATRNTYLVLRRLGMPTDFFWKFGYWDEKRAFETLDKVISRVFTALMSKQKMGELQLVAVHPDTATFEIAFENCAECAGLTASAPMCFFHGGSFAGMLAAMLDEGLSATEVECVATGGERCRFMIRSSDDRASVVALDRWCAEFECHFEPERRFGVSLKNQMVRPTGNMVDIHYYQMLLAGAFLSNIDLIERACFEAGQAIGKSLLDTVRDMFGDDPSVALPSFYKSLRYANVVLAPSDDGGFEIKISEAPEHFGSLERSSLVPFLSGEIESLVSGLTGPL
ncbi:MAG: 4-vinyl reductase [Chloroflexi bacterium]|nr:4-vinyl reductase [Chloroflexota bacterium]MDA1173164.1 4-vinyl reductase [Chloroflexota bacterium]